MSASKKPYSQPRYMQKLPDGWTVEPLGAIAVKIQDGTHFSPKIDGGPIRYITSRNIRAGRLSLETCEWISEAEHRNIYARCDVKTGDVLLTKDGANTGNAAINTLSEPFSMLSSVAFIRLDDNRFLNAYLLHQLCSPRCQQRLKDLMSGNAITRLTLQKIKAFPVPFPGAAEQRLIAEILDTVDEAICKTEQIIAKLEQVKQGLLHDLLTRGIDENGQLRDPDRHPELFKDSELGRIPKEWEAVRLTELADNFDGRRIPLKQSDRDRRNGPYRYYGASGIIDWIDDYLFDGEFVLLGEDGENVVSRRLPLAFCVAGKFWVNNHAHVFAPKPGIDIRFLTEAMEATDYGSVTSGSAQPKITQGALRRLWFPCPPPQEQSQIADMLAAHEVRREREVKANAKLRLAKQGLMDDLLTGRVRVTELLQGAAG